MGRPNFISKDKLDALKYAMCKDPNETFEYPSEITDENALLYLKDHKEAYYQRADKESWILWLLEYVPTHIEPELPNSSNEWWMNKEK